MSDKDKKEWRMGIAAILSTFVLAFGTAEIIEYGAQKTVIANIASLKESQDRHFVAAEKHEEKQDERIDGHETRIDGVEHTVARLAPSIVTEERVTMAIDLVHAAMDRESRGGVIPCWVPVQGASREYIGEELLIRVEEHFRRLGYEVSRQRDTSDGRVVTFWIYVGQGETSGLPTLVGTEG